MSSIQKQTMPVVRVQSSGLQKGLAITVTVIVIGAAAYGGYKLYKKGKKAADPNNRNKFNWGYSERERVQSLDKMIFDTSKLTISNNNMNLIVEEIHRSMNQAGTDEKALFEQLEKFKTYDDLMCAIKKFGLRRYLWYMRTEYVGERMNMVGWIKSELSGSDLKKAKEIFQKLNVPF